MKPGEKYIIEIDHTTKTADGERAYIKGFRTLVFDQYGLDKLEKYDDKKVRKTIDDAIDAAYKRGFENGRALTRADGNAKSYSDGYNDGMEKAWTMVRAMYSGMAFGTLRRIFNMQDADTTNIVMEIIRAFPAAEVKKRLDAYEKETEQKEKEKQVPVNAYISLGDEVKFSPDNVTIIVTRLGYNFITGIDKHGSVYNTYGLPCNWEKTGRHFDLSKLFKFMRGGDGA